MTARTATVLGTRNPNNALQFGDKIRELKSLILETDATVDATDYITVNYARYGITTVQAIHGFKHTTDNSVVTVEQPTTSVTASVMTITVPAGTDNDKRIYQLFYT